MECCDSLLLWKLKKLLIKIQNNSIGQKIAKKEVDPLKKLAACWEHGQRKIYQCTEFINYAPNFEKMVGACCFRIVRPCMRLYKN